MEKITFGDAAVPGYERGEKSAPAVIVLQEWWGVTKNITAQAERIASEGGYRVLIPDLYKGKLGVNVEEAHHLMSNLDWPAAKGAIRHHAVATRALTPVVVVTSSDAPLKKDPPGRPPPPDEMCAAARYLKSTGSPKVAVIGFCMGGALALIAAQHSEDVDCCLPFYGTPDPSICQTETIAKPVQAHFGEEDTLAGFSDPAAAARLSDNLKRAGGAAFEVFAYPGVGHAFMNDLPEPYPDFDARRDAQGFPPRDEAQQKLAWRRAFAFLEKHLRG